MKLGDRICLLNDGHVEQIDTPQGFKDHPQTDFVKQFMGSHLEQQSQNRLTNIKLKIKYTSSFRRNVRYIKLS